MNRNEELHEDLIDLGVASVETQGGPIDEVEEMFTRRLPADSLSRD